MDGDKPYGISMTDEQRAAVRKVGQHAFTVLSAWPWAYRSLYMEWQRIGAIPSLPELDRRLTSYREQWGAYSIEREARRALKSIAIAEQRIRGGAQI